MKNTILSLSLLATGCAQPMTKTDAIPQNSGFLARVNTYQERQATLNPQKSLEWLVAGNERFAEGKAIHGGFVSDSRDRMAAAAISQRPLAVVLSCIDSRTSPELIFDTSVGDLFTVRVGANVVNDDILGSLEIAVESGARVLIVLGHTDCGGVKGACNHLQLGHMTQLLDRVRPAIAATNKYLDAQPQLSEKVGERIVSNRRYISEVSHMNAQQSASQIIERSPFLREKMKNKEIILVSAIYDVETGKVKVDSPR